ncbi:Putative ribonuclease H protein At1g65750 [Linum perenne]
MAIGGVIRDALGDWVAGFTNHIGRGSSFQAELLALRDGLSLIWTLGYRRVQVESDCLAVIELVTDTDIQNHTHAVLGYEIKELLTRNWDCTLKHVYREGNIVADLLAGQSHADERGEKWLLEAPSYIVQMLQEDRNGVLRFRE